MADNPEGYCIECEKDIPSGFICGCCEQAYYEAEMWRIQYGQDKGDE